MGSNKEIDKVQCWVADWCRTTPEECKFSRDDIRSICRGPMREVLLDFILPRFRRDEQIKVIRSNLYLHDLAHSHGQEAVVERDVAVQHDKAVKDLERKIENCEVEKCELVKQISKEFKGISESRRQAAKEAIEKLAVYEGLDSRAHLIRDRVRSTNALLEDLNQMKAQVEPVVIHPTTTSEQSSDQSQAEPVTSYLSPLRSLYDNAVMLFNLKVSSGASMNPVISADIENLTVAVNTQIQELTQSGLSPRVVENWARREQEHSVALLRNASLKYSNVMSPLGELSTEAEALHMKLMQTHVDLHMRNRELHQNESALKRQKNERIQHAILHDPSFVPADLLILIQKEEQQRQLVKCRELTKALRRQEAGDADNHDLLSLLCGDDPAAGSEPRTDTSKPHTQTSEYKLSRESLGCDMNSSFMKQEILEDLTCSLLRSYSSSRNQLESTIKQYKKLVLEQFPTVLDGGSNHNDNAFGMSENESDISRCLNIKIKIPQELAHDQDFPTLVSEDIYKEDKVRLAEVFRLQSELGKKKLQCEMMFSQRKLSTD